MQDFESLSDFSFVFETFAYAFFEGRGLSEDERCGGNGLEVLRFENDMILVVVGISNVMFGKVQEGLSTDLCRTEFVERFEVEFSEV